MAFYEKEGRGVFMGRGFVGGASVFGLTQGLTSYWTDCSFEL